MSLQEPDPDFCPCGCGERVNNPPIVVNNVWQHGKNHWAFMCHNPHCRRCKSEQLNQTGDSECPWCGDCRTLIGHFLHEDGTPRRGYRLTVLGERIPSRRNDGSAYWQDPNGALGRLA